MSFDLLYTISGIDVKVKVSVNTYYTILNNIVTLT